MVLKKLWIIKEHFLNALAMTFVLGMFYLSPTFGFILTLILLSTPVSPLVLLYLFWIYLDRKASHKERTSVYLQSLVMEIIQEVVLLALDPDFFPSHIFNSVMHPLAAFNYRIQWLRSAKLHQRFRDYFPLKLIKTADLPPTKNYIFCAFPHGLLGVAPHGHFSGENHEFEKLYPEINPICHTLNLNFYIPFSREYILSVGYHSVSKEDLINCLSTGSGKASVLVVGGSAEAMYSNPGVYKVTLKERKGFIKLAIITGSDLVPIYTFGENELYHQYIFPKDSIIYKIQEAIRSYTGVAPIFGFGRGIFQNLFGILPFKKPLYTVVGKPISVEKNENPTREKVAALHAIFIQELLNLFDEHKYNYLADPDSKVLTIV